MNDLMHSSPPHWIIKSRVFGWILMGMEVGMVLLAMWVAVSGGRRSIEHLLILCAVFAALGSVRLQRLGYSRRASRTAEVLCLALAGAYLIRVYLLE